MSPDTYGNPSTPWDWHGGYPQQVVSADAILVAEVFENPDMPASIAPLICAAVNAYLAPTRRERLTRWWRGRRARRLYEEARRRAAA